MRLKLLLLSTTTAKTISPPSSDGFYNFHAPIITGSDAEIKYNPHEEKWEYACPEAEIKYNPHEENVPCPTRKT